MAGYPQTPENIAPRLSPSTLEQIDITTGPALADSLRAIEKIELHVHLNGAVPTSEVIAILRDEQAKLPPSLDLQRDLVHRSACPSLAKYLTPWQALRLIPRQRKNLSRLVDAAMQSLRAQGIRAVELRSSVLYLATLQGCTVPEALQELIECTGRSATRYAMRRGLVLTVPRGDYSAVHLSALLEAYEALGRPREIVGIDLAGDEETPHPAELPFLFREAKHRFGLGLTVHAGETGRPENIRAALEQFDADRIGHGTAAGKDPELLELLAKRNVCVEVCPISNRLTGAVSPEESHPLREFQKHEVPFVLCSDNPAIHERGLIDDYMAAHTEGIALDVLQHQYETARRYSFMKDLT